ncbi:hypothetical protein D3C75_1173200 [compost metagenome]
MHTVFQRTCQGETPIAVGIDYSSAKQSVVDIDAHGSAGIPLTDQRWRCIVRESPIGQMPRHTTRVIVKSVDLRNCGGRGIRSVGIGGRADIAYRIDRNHAHCLAVGEWRI